MKGVVYSNNLHINVDDASFAPHGEGSSPSFSRVKRPV